MERNGFGVSIWHPSTKMLELILYCVFRNVSIETLVIWNVFPKNPVFFDKWSCDGREVKALDSKSNGVSPRRFESCSQRLYSNDCLNIHWNRSPDQQALVLVKCQRIIHLDQQIFPLFTFAKVSWWERGTDFRSKIQGLLTGPVQILPTASYSKLIQWQSCNSVSENMYHSCLCLLNLTNHYEVLKTDILPSIKGHFCLAQVPCDSVWIKCRSELCILGCDGRVVKALDLKSNGYYPRRFKSCSQRQSSIDCLNPQWIILKDWGVCSLGIQVLI